MRLIDADAYIAELEQMPMVQDAIRKSLEHMPTIEERKTGRWIYKNDLKQFFCDQCGEPSLTDDDVYIYSMDFPNFCPNCGADMKGGKS